MQCYINLAVAPAPWIDWSYARSSGAMPKSIGQHLGLFRRRMHPQSGVTLQNGYWEFSKPRHATRIVKDMAERLRADGWPLLDRLLDRDALLAELRAEALAQNDAPWFIGRHAMAEAILICDDGPSDALDDALARHRSMSTPRTMAHTERLEAWVRARAAAAEAGAT